VSNRFSFASVAGQARPLVVFRLNSQMAAFPAESVERVAPMAALLRPPGLPAALEGVLNLAGAAIPVVSLTRLFRLPPQKPGLYSMLVVLQLSAESRIAAVVDRVTDIVAVPAYRLRPLDREDFFNGCVEAVVDIEGQSVHLLSIARIMLAKEREVLAEFGEVAQQRLRDWQGMRT
jgi:purine-binding chemotaxis protein CheW